MLTKKLLVIDKITAYCPKEYISQALNQTFSIIIVTLSYSQLFINSHLFPPVLPRSFAKFFVSDATLGFQLVLLSCVLFYICEGIRLLSIIIFLSKRLFIKNTRD